MSGTAFTDANIGTSPPISPGPDRCQTVGALRASLWHAGFRPVAVYTVAEGRRLGHAKPGKHPVGDGWQVRARLDPPEAAYSKVRDDQSNTGILTDALQLIDLDIDDTARAKACADLAYDMFGEAPTRYRQSSPRRAILYRAAAGQPKKQKIAGDHGVIEVLGRGNQFVGFGDHESCDTLEWIGEPPGETTVADLPAVTPEQIADYLRQCAAIIEAEPPRPNNERPIGPPPRSGRPLTELLERRYRGWIETQLDKLRAAVDGDKHNTLVRVGYTIGGIQAAAQLAEADALQMLMDALPDSVEDWDHAKKTALAALAYGRTEPFDLPDRPRPNGPDSRPPPPPLNEDEDPQPEPTPEPEEEKKEEEKPELTFVPQLWVWRDPSTIEPREWLVGTILMRGYATLLGGSGGVGKTATAIATTLAYITGRRDILNAHVFQTGKAWINCLEDDELELERRIHAAMIAHNVSKADVEGKLFINTADKHPVILARLNPETGAFEIGTDAAALQAGITALGIGLTIIDPLVKAHRVIENSNEHMDQLEGIANNIASGTQSALLLPCHFRKGGGEGGNRDAFRGGGSLIDGARITRSVTPMNEKEAEAWKIPQDEAFRHIKLTDPKSNLAPKEKAHWLRLASIPLGNTNVHPAYKAGDSVQAVIPWQPPTPFEGLDYDALSRIFEALRRPPPDAADWFYSPSSRQKHWAGAAIMEIASESRDQATAIIATWSKSQVFSEEAWTTPTNNKATKLVLNEAKVAEIMAPITPQKTDDC